MRRIRVAGQSGGSRQAAPLQAEALALFARMTTPPSAGYRDAVNYAIWRWKAIGAWAEIKGLWLLCADTAQAANLSAIGDTARDAEAVGAALTFTPLKGYSGFDASRQLRFPITSTILASDNAFGFMAGRVSPKVDNSDPDNPVTVAGCFIKSAAGTGQGVIGNWHYRNQLFAEWAGTISCGPTAPIVEHTSASSVLGGARAARVITPAGLISVGGASGAARSSNYITEAMAYHPLDRLSAYGFLSGAASDTLCRRFLVILAALLDQLEALD